MQPCTVYRERELVRRREEKKKGKRERENSGFFFLSGWSWAALGCFGNGVWFVCIPPFIAALTEIYSMYVDC